MANENTTSPAGEQIDDYALERFLVERLYEQIMKGYVAEQEAKRRKDQIGTKDQLQEQYLVLHK